MSKTGNVGRYRTSIAQDARTCVVGARSFGGLLAGKCRTQFLPGILTRTSRKKAATE